MAPTPRSEDVFRATTLFGVPGLLLTLMITLAGAIVTAHSWRATAAAQARDARAELAVHATDIQTSIQARMLTYKGLLHAGVGLVDTIGPVSSEQWRIFTRQMSLSAGYPGIHGLGFAAVFRHPGDLEQWRHALGPRAPFDHPDTHTDNVFPQSAIVLLEPRDARNLRAMGFNMMSEGVRRTAMDRARDQGRIALSGGLTLLQELDDPAAQPGFVLYAPAYDSSSAPENVAERRAALRGFVYSAFRAHDFFGAAINISPEKAIFEVVDGGPGSRDVLYRNASAPEGGELVDVRTLTIGGRDWTLRVWPGARFGVGTPTAAHLVALSGAAITLLLATIIAMLSLSRQRLRERMDAAQQLAVQQSALNEELERRVAQRTAQLEAANRELSAANRDLETFSYTVSHDLRAPLRAVNGHLELFIEQAGEISQSQLQHVNSIRRNISRMAQMIEDLLRLAFVSRQPLERECASMHSLLAPIVDEVRRTYYAEVLVQPDLGEVHADPALLRQALTNLLLNAGKFSRNARPPRVWIGAEERDGERVYYIKDNGVGFDMKHASKLFGVFERLHHARDFEGSGVGLAIVKQIIERHEGRVWAYSEPGCGATFYFTFGGATAATLKSAA